MKKSIAAVAALAVLGIALLFLRSTHQPPGESNATSPPAQAQIAPGLAASKTNIVPTNVSSPAPPITPPTVVSHPTPAVPASAPTPTLPLVDGLPPATVLDNLRNAVRQCGLRFGGNPVGTNPEITRALNGGNPKQVRFIPPGSGLRINDQGELIDSWGTPFFFHQLSAMEMEIRSAGPDKVMWTDDDLVTR